MSRSEDESFMRRALDLARAAVEQDEVPVGAVCVVDGRVVSGAFNRRELDRDPTAHAELIAMRDAAQRLGRWRLNDVTVYVTLEPCAMCAGVMVNARVGRLVYGAPDPKAGAVRSVFAILDEPRLNHRVAVEGGLLGDESAQLLRDFFRARRA